MCTSASSNSRRSEFSWKTKNIFQLIFAIGNNSAELWQGACGVCARAWQPLGVCIACRLSLHSHACAAVNWVPEWECAACWRPLSGRSDEQRDVCCCDVDVVVVITHLQLKMSALYRSLSLWHMLWHLWSVNVLLAVFHVSLVVVVVAVVFLFVIFWILDNFSPLSRLLLSLCQAVVAAVERLCVSHNSNTFRCAVEWVFFLLLVSALLLFVFFLSCAHIFAWFCMPLSACFG